MIITLAYAKRLIKAGKATLVTTCDHGGNTHIVLNRHDLQRTDHAITPDINGQTPYMIGTLK
jgi:hypothetical protein